jgi:hypothetical protein
MQILPVLPLPALLIVPPIPFEQTLLPVLVPPARGPTWPAAPKGSVRRTQQLQGLFPVCAAIYTVWNAHNKSQE